jgi:hypothetical protein
MTLVEAICWWVGGPLQAKTRSGARQDNAATPAPATSTAIPMSPMSVRFITHHNARRGRKVAPNLAGYGMAQHPGYKRRIFLQTVYGE